MVCGAIGSVGAMARSHQPTVLHALEPDSMKSTIIEIWMTICIIHEEYMLFSKSLLSDRLRLKSVCEFRVY